MSDGHKEVGLVLGTKFDRWGNFLYPIAQQGNYDQQPYSKQQAQRTCNVANTKN